MHYAAIFLQIPEANNNILMMVMWVAVFAILYFMILRPQSQRGKKEKEFVEQIQKGTKVVTKSGIHGKIVGVSDKTILLEVDNNVKLKIDRTAISMEMTEELAS